MPLSQCCSHRQWAGLFQNIIYKDVAIFNRPDLAVLVREIIQNQVCYILRYRSDGILQRRAYLNLCHVSSPVSGNVGPSTKWAGKIILISRKLAVQDVEVQDNFLLVHWSGLMEAMYQTRYLSAGSRDIL